MNSNKSSTQSFSQRGGGIPFLAGFLFAIVIACVGTFCFLKYGNPPVATADPAFPYEAEIVRVPLDARIMREKQHPPFPVSESVFEQGASIYKASCSSCHGLPGQSVDYAKWMFPRAPQFWNSHISKKTGKVVIGASDGDPGAIHWKVQNGIRLSGMPAFNHILSDAEIWDVDLLIKNADQPMSDSVKAALK